MEYDSKALSYQSMELKDFVTQPKKDLVTPNVFRVGFQVI